MSYKHVAMDVSRMVVLLGVGLVCALVFATPLLRAEAASGEGARMFDKRVNLKVNKADGPVFLEPTSDVTISWAARGVKGCSLALMSARRADVTFAKMAVKAGNGSQTFTVPGVADEPALLRLTCTSSNGKQTLVDEVALNHDWTSPNATTKSTAVSPVLPLPRVGEAMAVLTMGTASTNKISSTTGEFTLAFDVTASGDDVYVPTTAARSLLDTSAGVNFRMENSDNSTAGRGSVTSVLSSAADEVSGYYIIREGETETFTLKVVFDPISAGQYKLQLLRLNWNTTTATPTKGAAPKPINDFETKSVILTN